MYQFFYTEPHSSALKLLDRFIKKYRTLNTIMLFRAIGFKYGNEGHFSIISRYHNLSVISQLSSGSIAVVAR